MTCRLPSAYFFFLGGGLGVVFFFAISPYFFLGGGPSVGFLFAISPYSFPTREIVAVVGRDTRSQGCRNHGQTAVQADSAQPPEQAV